MIGYNPAKANKVIDQIEEQYEELKLYLPDAWREVQDVLRANWIGPDEQDFEIKFIKRLYELQRTAHNLTKQCSETIASLVQEWDAFQSKNTLTGEEASAILDVQTSIRNIVSRCRDILSGLGKLATWHEHLFLITFVPMKIDANTTRGLQQADSASQIQSALDTFVGNIKNKVNGLFSTISVSDAFFGDYSSQVKTYVDYCGEAVGTIATAVKDLYEALSVLASSRYQSESSANATAFQQNKSAVESQLNDLGNSRWT